MAATNVEMFTDSNFEEMVMAGGQPVLVDAPGACRGPHHSAQIVDALAI